MPKTIVAASLAASLALTGAAMAADIYAPVSAKDVPVYAQSWTGFYIGAAVGGIHNDVKASENYEYSDYYYNWQYAGSSGFGSLNIGYNFQFGSLVYGIEADYGFGNAAGSDKSSETGYGVYSDASEKLKSLGTVRARLGYALDHSLLYVTGGFAYGEVKHDYWYYSGAEYNYSKSGTQTGWVVGAGFEQALNDRLILTGQVLYADLGSTSISTDSGYYVYGFNNQAYTATVGLKYKLGGYGYEPLK